MIFDNCLFFVSFFFIISTEINSKRFILQVDGLRKVYEIFTSLTVDPGVKKSAIDQLAIILQGQYLY